MSDELTRAIAEATEGGRREGTAKWPECCRDTYSLAIEEIAAALAPLIEARAREARAYMVEVAESVGWHHLGDDYYADGMKHAKEQIVAALKHEAEDARNG